MADEGYVVGLCAGIPGPIVVEAVGDVPPGVDLPFQALDWQGFIVGHRPRPYNGASRSRTARCRIMEVMI